MQARPFLMFQSEARQALDLWQRAVPGFEIVSLDEHADGEMAGQVQMAEVKIGGGIWQLYDSPPVHGFTFTPSSSIFVDCDDEAQLRAMAEALGEDGGVMMPIDDYGFSRLFTWLADRFGVSWQLNLPGE